MKTKFFLILIIILVLAFPLQTSNAIYLGEVDTPSALGNVRLELAGQIPNPATVSVAVQGDYAYVDISSRLVVIDISNKANPMPVGQTEVLPGIAGDILVSGDFAYVAGGSYGVYIIDISDPEAPSKVGHYTTTETLWEARGLDLYETNGDLYLTIAAGGACLSIIDVTNPINPVNPSSPTRVSSAIPECVASDVAVQGDYAYIAAFGKLPIYDISNPASPSLAGTYQDTLETWSYQDIAVAGDYAYLSAYYSGGDYVVVIDIHDLADLHEEGKTKFQYTRIKDLALQGTRLYLATTNWNFADGLLTVDVINPANPQHSNGFPVNGNPSGVAVSGSYAYLSGSMDFTIINTSSTPYTLAGNYGTCLDPRAVSVSGKRAYLGAGAGRICVVDISDPADPQIENTKDISKAIDKIETQGNYAYTGGSSGFVIVDISDPINPVEMGNRGGSIEGLEMSGHYLYAATYGNFSIADVSNPLAPEWVGNVLICAWNSDVSLNGIIAYDSNAACGVRVFNVNNPASPYQIGLYDPDPSQLYFTAVDYDDQVLYAGEMYANQLHIIDVSDPAHPEKILAYGTYGNIRDLVTGRNQWIGPEKRFVYAADYPVDNSSTVSLLDTTDPTSPIKLAESPNYNRISDIEVVGNYIYAATEGTGFVILRQLQDVISGTVQTSGGSLVSTTGDTQLTFPNGAFSDDVVVTYKHLWTDQDEYPRAGIGHTIDVTAVYSDTGETAQLETGKSFEVRINYTRTGSAIENTLALYGWDSSSGQWTSSGISSSVNTGTNIVTAHVDHLSLFAVLGDTNWIHMPLIVKH